MVYRRLCSITWSYNKQTKFGTFSDISTYSFFPGKNLGAFGDAGAINTNEEKLAILCRKLADGGRLSKYEHEILGWNSRLDTIHASVLDVKLTLLEEWNTERRKIANIYDERLSKIEQITLPKKIDNSEPVYHLYPLLVNNREKFINYLGEYGVSTGIHYPIPLHLQKAFSYLGHKGDFPILKEFVLMKYRYLFIHIWMLKMSTMFVMLWKNILVIIAELQVFHQIKLLQLLFQISTNQLINFLIEAPIVRLFFY